MDNDFYNQNALFVGRVLGVDPANYTISIRPEAGRMGFSNVRVLSPNSAYVNNKFRGFAWMPHPGDWVVCGYLEGYPDLPICFGVLYNYTNARPPEAAVGSNGEYQYYDFVVQHETGSFIRMRNLNQPVFANNIWTQPAYDLPEVVISQQLANDAGTNNITMTETAAGTSTINITHHSGATIQIDKDGNIIITPKSGQEIRLGGNTAGHGVPFGDSLQTWLDNHKHTTGMGPSGPPIPPLSPNPSSAVMTL